MTADPVGADRRAVLQAGLGATLAWAAAPALAAQGAVGLPDPATLTWLRLVADLSGRTVASITEGMVWGFKPQADDLAVEDFARRLYGYRSLILRTATPRPDGAVGLVTQGWSFYTDAVSGAVIDTLANPYTGMTVSCPPLAVGPGTTVYGGGAAAPAAPLDLRRRAIGQHAFVEVTRLSRFKPADTTWFKLEADLTTYSCRAADLAGRGRHVPSTWSHSLVAEWQTWMRMHGAPGHILFNGQGAVLADGTELPAALYDAVGRFFPNSRGALDDWRKARA